MKEEAGKKRPCENRRGKILSIKAVPFDLLEGVCRRGEATLEASPIFQIESLRNSKFLLSNEIYKTDLRGVRLLTLLFAHLAGSLFDPHTTHVSLFGKGWNPPEADDTLP